MQQVIRNVELRRLFARRRTTLVNNLSSVVPEGSVSRHFTDSAGSWDQTEGQAVSTSHLPWRRNQFPKGKRRKEDLAVTERDAS